MLISNFWHILAAVFPSILILIYIFKQDQFPEPKGIVFKTFVLGASITLALDLLIGDVDQYAEKYFVGETLYFFDSFIRAAFLEEFFKMLVIIFYCTRKDEFDEPMDGLIYGVAASIGFATYENIQYVLYYLKEPSFEIAWLRAYTAVPMHALCGVMMGFLITQSIFEKKYNYPNLILALLIPVGIHGIYNYSLTSEILSSQISNVVLFIFLIRAILIFKDLKFKQKRAIIFNKKYYIIDGTKFIQAASTVLLIYLFITFIVSLNY